jgi:hypothetical protein
MVEDIQVSVKAVSFQKRLIGCGALGSSPGITTEAGLALTNQCLGKMNEE